MKLDFSKRFKKSVAKFSRDEKIIKKLDKFFVQIATDPFYPALKTHKVESRNYGKIFASRFTNDLRILWNFADAETILIFDIGTHDEIYI